MTREQSKHIRSVERIIDRLNERIEKIQDEQSRSDFFDNYPQGFSDGGDVAIIGEFKTDMSEVGKKVRDLALAELKKLQDKYLQVYAAL